MGTDTRSVHGGPRTWSEWLDEIEKYAAERRIPELADAVLVLAAGHGPAWAMAGNQVAVVLRGLDDEAHDALSDAFVARYRAESHGSEVRQHVLELLRDTARHTHGTYGARSGPARSRPQRLLIAADQFVHLPPGELADLVTAELADGREVLPEVVAVLRRTAVSQERPDSAPLQALMARFPEPVVSPGEAWADRALADLAAPADGGSSADTGSPGDTGVPADPPGREETRALLRHATSATTARPSAAWEATARELVAAAGPGTVRAYVLRWLELAPQPRTHPLFRPLRGPDPNALFDDFNSLALRGLLWLVPLLPPDRDTVRACGALLEQALRKVPGHGPRSSRLANAAVLALSRTEGEAALGELARLASRVVHKGVLKQFDAALTERAAALGMSRDEIEELAVPTYGLTEVGRSVTRLGGADAELTVRGGRAVLRWRNDKGKQVKSPPAAVRRDHPDAVKELKAVVKDVDRMLSARSARLDRQFLERRTWTYAAWRERYLDHPLVGTLARRLLWTVDGRTCGYDEAAAALRALPDGACADGALPDGPVPPDPAAPVELWHPAGRAAAEVAACREWLERHGVTQPFKQAHREVYPLTDAERATGVHSNRFAAHVLRQHQFNSLAAQRGWRNQLRLCVDDMYEPAVRELPRHGLRAELWVEAVGDDWRTDLTDSGTHLWVATDQVRFYPADAPRNLAHASGGPYEMWLRDGAEPVDPVPLADVPPLVLSEVLRDVDLFVGVSSVGNDPTWQDGGPRGRFREYWTSYGFGELSRTAETRRALLSRLVPRLAVADRCSIEGRFLHVRGELHTYRVHLGSGNVLMSPNDAYLCIVPKPTGAGTGTGTGADAGVETGDAYLPFEGDRMLAVILSKVTLLARDTEITDPAIVSQL